MYVRDCACVFLFPLQSSTPICIRRWPWQSLSRLLFGWLKCFLGRWLLSLFLFLPPSVATPETTVRTQTNKHSPTLTAAYIALHCLCISKRTYRNPPLLGTAYLESPIPGFFTQLSFGQRFLRAFPLPTTLGLAERQKTAIQKRTPLGPVSRRQRHCVTLGALQDFTPPPPSSAKVQNSPSSYPRVLASKQSAPVYESASRERFASGPASAAEPGHSSPPTFLLGGLGNYDGPTAIGLPPEV